MGGASAEHPLKRSRRGRAAVVSGILLWLLALTLPVTAQPVPHGLLEPGNAAVTGFSGAIKPSQIAPGINPLGFTFIDLNGASLRVIDLQNMGGPPQGQLVAAPKPFTITASQIGQVFAVALDDAVPPNIYAAATSAFGLHVARPGRDGQLTHARIGQPGTVFMPGMWGGAAPDGGPGSVWKIDGVTGAVTLFANLKLDGRGNSGAAVGGMAYDPDSKSFFVADRETGMIHRLGLDGREIGRYDHGVQARSSMALQPVAYDGAKRLDITSVQFNASDPETWNYAAPERRIFGLGIRNGRLYYAVAQGLQIWSARIGPQELDQPVLEFSVPPGSGVSEISKITFDDQGRMILAERAKPSGTEDFEVLAKEAVGRVLRYAITGVSPGLPRTWQAVPDDYAIGFSGAMTNGNGGVAIGFDYDNRGRIDRGSCGGFLWSTGEQLRQSGDPRVADRLRQWGPANVDGLQGNYVWSVRPANTPPLRSYFIDYDDRFDDNAARGYLGDVAIWRVCGPVLRGGWMLPSWFAWVEDGGAVPPPPVLSCSPEQQKPGFQCCPKGTSPDAAGRCIPWCPNGKMDSASQNLCGLGFDIATYNPIDSAGLKCIGGNAPVEGKGILGCVEHSPVLNPPICPAGWTKQNLANVGNVCQAGPQQMQCPQGQQVSLIDNKCHPVCLSGTAWPSMQCCASGSGVTPTGQCCPVGASVDPATGACRRLVSQCPPGSKLNSKTGACEPPGKSCPAGSEPDPKTGACTKLVGFCLPGLTADPATGECRKLPPKLSCAPSQQTSEGTCCKPGWSPNAAGGCCPPGQQAGAGGLCKPTACFAPNKDVGGRCCSPEDLKSGGACANMLCGLGRAPTGSSNACCEEDRIYPTRNGSLACCPVALTGGRCSPPSKGVPVQPQCAPGSTDPGCCAPGYKSTGTSCCLATQLTSTGQCCPPGQTPSGPNQSQCGPSFKGGIPPWGGGSTTSGGGGQCCVAGSIPIASGVCCATNQVTSTGICCPAGQQPDPKDRRSCVRISTCGPRETMVNGECCSNSHLYKDAAGHAQCCGQVVDPLANVCPGTTLREVPQCFPGYTRTSDGTCCADHLVMLDGRCSRERGSPRLAPVPVPLLVPNQTRPAPPPPRNRSEAPPLRRAPPERAVQPSAPASSPQPPVPRRPALRPPVRPGISQIRPMPAFRPQLKPPLRRR
jgi:hypothetical protein